MIREVEKDLNKLGERCEEIDTIVKNDRCYFENDNEVKQIIVDLKDTLREYPNGVGLAAPQIGINKRLFVIRFANNDYRSFINPLIVSAKGQILSREGCLSLPGEEYLMPRSNYIIVRYTTPMGKIVDQQLYGMTACIFQHELAHLDGACICDYGLPITEDYDNMSKEEQEEIQVEYLKSLEEISKDLNKQIEEDPELNKIDKAIEFMKDVAKGKTKVELRPFTEEEMDQARNKAQEGE